MRVILAPLYGTLQSIIGGLTLVLLIAVASSFRFGFQDTKQTALPLAPFLAIGGIAAFFFRIKAIFHFVLRRINMNSVSNLLHLAQQGDKEAEARLIIRYGIYK